MGNCIVVGPHEAAVRSGQGGLTTAVGKTIFVWGVCQQHEILDLGMKTIVLESVAAESAQGVRVDVVGIAQVKVDAYMINERKVSDTPKLNNAAINLAAQHFLGDSEESIKEALKQTLEGHQRQIIGNLTVEELYRNRSKFTEQIRSVVVRDLAQFGFALVSYVVESISDETGYMDSLGIIQTSIVRREAEQGMAYHDQEARKVTAAAESQAESEIATHSKSSHVRVNTCKEVEAQAQRSLQLKNAEFFKEISHAQAEASSSYDIEMAKQNQRLVYENTRNLQVEANEQNIVADIAVERNQREKAGTSEAELMAQKNHATGIKIASAAQASKIRTIGTAEADVLLKQGEAEADAMESKAKAIRNFKDAAVIDMVVSKLPEITEAFAKPFESVDKLVFVSTNGKGGPSQFTQEIITMINSVPNSVNSLTGFDMKATMRDIHRKSHPIQSKNTTNQI